MRIFALKYCAILCNSHNLCIIQDFRRIICQKIAHNLLKKKTHNSRSPVVRKNATYSQLSVIHPLIIFAVIIKVYCTYLVASDLNSVFQKKRVFCMPSVNMVCWSATEAVSVNCLRWFTNSICRQFSGAEWRIIIGSYIPQACSLRYWGISPLNMSLL